MLIIAHLHKYSTVPLGRQPNAPVFIFTLRHSRENLSKLCKSLIAAYEGRHAYLARALPTVTETETLEDDAP